MFLAISHAPRSVITDRMLPEVYQALDKLELYREGGGKVKRAEGGGEKGKKLKEKDYEGNGVGYWDDYCLAKFLEGVCLRYVAYPVGLEALFFLLLFFGA
jgi:hypothetical protein